MTDEQRFKLDEMRGGRHFRGGRHQGLIALSGGPERAVFSRFSQATRIEWNSLETPRSCGWNARYER